MSKNVPGQTSATPGAGSSTGPGIAAGERKRRRKKPAAATTADPIPPTPAAIAPDPSQNPNQNGDPNTDDMTAQRKRARRRSVTFAHKRRRGMFPGRAYVVPDRGLDELVDRRMSTVSLTASVPPASASGRVREGGNGDMGMEVGVGVDGEAGKDKGKAREVDTQMVDGSQAPNGQRPPSADLEPEDAGRWGKERWSVRRAKALDSVLLNSMALGLGTADTLPSNDLLLSLHAHAASFFASNGALRCPRPVWRGKLFENQKRAEIQNDMEERTCGQFQSQYRFGRLIVDEEPEMAEYELAKARYEADLKNPAYRRHKRADMHTALEGSALLALGVLVEETVAHELREAGYVMRATTVGTAGGDGGEDGNGSEKGDAAEGSGASDNVHNDSNDN